MDAKPIVLITGASAGIGRATALLFAENGYNLIITARREDRLRKLSSELTDLGANVHCLCFDISNRSATTAAINSLPADFKPIDVLVNNAGLAMGKAPFAEAEIEDWEVMIDTNVKGLLYISRLIAPNMTKRGKGHIINVSSIAGLEVYAGGTIYNATKFAVEAIGQSMRIDMLPYGIKVTNINPGLVETEFSMVRFKGDAEKAKATYEGLVALSAYDVADTIWYAASRPAHVNINQIVITPKAQASAHYVIRE